MGLLRSVPAVLLAWHFSGVWDMSVVRKGGWDMANVESFLCCVPVSCLFWLLHWWSGTDVCAILVLSMVLSFVEDFCVSVASIALAFLGHMLTYLNSRIGL